LIEWDREYNEIRPGSETCERLAQWFRTHAEVVVEAMELPELTSADLNEHVTRGPIEGLVDTFERGYDLACDRLRALQPQPPTTREVGR
jgi:hypothetical protein